MSVISQPVTDSDISEPIDLEVSETTSSDSDDRTRTSVVLPQVTCEPQQDVTQQLLQKPPHVQPISSSESPVTSPDSELDSDCDCMDANDQEFCANCFRQPPDCTLKRCTRCLLSYYCSVRCQREDWQDHKLACPVISSQRKAATGASFY